MSKNKTLSLHYEFQMVHLFTELLFVLYLTFYFVFYFVICRFALIELPLFLMKVYILFYLIELLSFACFFPL